MSRAYYNEIDPYAAAWVRNLIAEGLIAPGDVDERSIVDVKPSDLTGYTQCHFFAGIGGWSLALRLAGVPDTFPVWTGSCPCQPFSAAGKGGGFDDERHLWPHFHHLIRVCRPAIVAGEQVASKDGLGWLDLVQTDLEGRGEPGRECGTECFAGARGVDGGLENPCGERRDGFSIRILVGGPRQDSSEAAGGSPNGGLADAQGDGRVERGAEPSERCALGRCGCSGLADADGRHTAAEREQRSGEHGRLTEDRGVVRVADADEQGSGGRGVQGSRQGPSTSARASRKRSEGFREDCGSSQADGFWRAADWLYCRDGKWRPAEPGTFPLANGSPARVGRLRAYGNAIVPQVAALFVRGFLNL